VNSLLLAGDELGLLLQRVLFIPTFICNMSCCSDSRILDGHEVGTEREREREREIIMCCVEGGLLKVLC
jgi:hypothetical protein